jgi:hypothetical protein
MSDDDYDYAAVAYIRDGRLAVMASVLSVLHDDGSVQAGRAGSVRRAETGAAPHESLERTVWTAIHGFVSPGALMARPSVDRALNDLRRRCRRLGLIRPLLPARVHVPARTQAGRDLISAARRSCPWPPSPEHGALPSQARIGMPVAIYGSEALQLLVPEFARDSGLLSRASTDGLDWADPDASPGKGKYY